MKAMTIENKLKWLFQTLYLVWVVALVPLVSHAYQTESVDYVVRCDKQRQQITVAESKFMPAMDIQSSLKAVSESKVDLSALIKFGGTEDEPLTLPAGRKTYECRLGRALYRIVIEPYIFNTRAMGTCGAVGPVISLSVRRNGKLLFSNINFDNCSSGRAIHRIQITEPAKSIKVLALLDPRIRVERTFPLTSFPKEWEKAIYEDTSTGDVNADLFIAVYKRSLSAVQQAIGRGANPNATNVDGFPPLALLAEGRRMAHANRTLVEFDHLSESIARVLFAAGASGKAANPYGLTLLEFLIGRVPATVIDMILAHGASALDGYPLRNAVMLGDAKLAKRLIAEGAEPNKKGPDRTTPLWTASTSGFYTFGEWDTPLITEYAKCIRLLLQSGATVRDAIPDQEGLLWMLVRTFGKDERLKLILTELIPYSDRESIDQAQKLAAKIANGNAAYGSLAQWLKEYIR